MRKTTLLNLIGILLVLVANTQLLGQPLSSTQWYRIRTPHFDVIFKSNISREAQRVANTMEHLYEPVTQSLGVKPAKVAVVLRTQNASSNGFLALAPRMMEWCTFPPQNYNFTGINDWLSLLAVHELRHVAQCAQMKQNFNQLAYWLGGDLFLGTMLTLNAPLWFLEGDAVGIETAFTQSGRGRIPQFSLLYRTNLLAHRRYSYVKQVSGSFKELVPDYYRVGYHLTTHLRRKYGPTVLADIFQQTTLPRLFTTAVKRTTGSRLRQIYEATNQELKACWQRQLRGLKFTQAKRLHTRSDTDYMDYAYPQLNKEGDIIVLKSGIGTVAQFVRLNGTQRAHKIFTPGCIDQGIGFSVAQNKIVWVETIKDPRWEDRSYRVIQCYDTQAKRLKTLTHKSRYGSAALSPDATQIVAFESDEGYNHQLVILDAENGQVLQRLPNPDNHFYLTPKWSEDGKQIVVVKNVRQRVTIARINVSTGETQDLLPYATAHLGCPVMTEQYVLHNSAYSGIDNIYAIDLTTCQRYQVTSRKYGAYNPTISADGRWLIFNDFTKDGMDVAKMPFDSKQWTPLEQVADRSVNHYTPLVAQENNCDLLAHVPNRTYPVEHYHPWKHLFNVHSWLTINQIARNVSNPQQPSDLIKQVDLDILRSNNLLGTTALVTNYLHDFKEKFGKISAKISYKGWYPVVSLEGTLQRNYNEKINYDQSLGLTLELPLTFVRGQYTHYLSLRTTGSIYKTNNHIFYTQAYKSLFRRNSKKSLRDIYCPWGQKLDITYQYMHYSGGTLWLKEPFKANAALYFPGLTKHHAFRLETTYQYTPTNEFRRLLHTSSPGGCSDKHIKNPLSVSVHYDCPIYYPDWGLDQFFYVKRLRANAFYGFVAGAHPHKDKTSYTNKVSMGLLADMHCFMLPELLEIGMQYCYALEQKKRYFLFVFSFAP
jgi:hypothetical protein